MTWFLDLLPDWPHTSTLHPRPSRRHVLVYLDFPKGVVWSGSSPPSFWSRVLMWPKIAWAFVPFTKEYLPSQKLYSFNVIYFFPRDLQLSLNNFCHIGSFPVTSLLGFLWIIFVCPFRLIQKFLIFWILQGMSSLFFCIFFLVFITGIYKWYLFNFNFIICNVAEQICHFY